MSSSTSPADQKSMAATSAPTMFSSGLLPGQGRLDLKLQQMDPSSPLHSVKKFEELGLSEELLKGIQDMGFEAPSRIQQDALPLIVQRKENVIAQSQSGTGKTACFVLGMLSRVDPTVNAPQAICISPTRELARQIATVVERMAKFTSIRCAWIGRQDDPSVPKAPIHDHVVVGTPGTMYNMMRSPGFDPRTRQPAPGLIDTRQVKIFVIDEAESIICNYELYEQAIKIFKVIPWKTVQVLLFSATWANTDVQERALKFAPKANKLWIERDQVNLENIKQFYVAVGSSDDKLNVLLDLYANLDIGESIIFCNTIHGAQWLTDQMRHNGFTVSLLHGKDMASSERDRIMQSFRDGTTKVLITTNVLSRGIDVPQVSMVVNFDVPTSFVAGRMLPDAETFIHRVGRTGRFGKVGIAVTLVSSHDEKVNLSKISEIYDIDFEEVHKDNIASIKGILASIPQVPAPSESGSVPM